MARHTLTRLGGIFPKLGQVASTRVDVVPAHYRAEFALLRSSCAAEPLPKFAPIMLQLDGHLAGLEPTPLGVGAIAQVHRALLRDSRSLVAVKLIKPRAARAWDADLRIARHACRLADGVARRFGLSLRTGFADLEVALEAHRDLRDEADAMVRVARACVNNGLRVRIPVPVLPVTRDVLVSDLVDGVQADSPQLTPELARQAALEAMVLLFRMIFDIGVVHCDLHPGNLLVGADGCLAVVDFGGCRRLTPSTRAAFRDLFTSIGTRDGTRAAALFLGMSEPSHEATGALDKQTFILDVQALLDEVHRKQTANFRVVRFVDGVFRIHRRHGLVAGSDFIAIILALLVFEGTALRLIPDVDFQRVALEVLMDPWHMNDESFAAECEIAH